jgi:hypothetical protein
VNKGDNGDAAVAVNSGCYGEKTGRGSGAMIFLVIGNDMVIRDEEVLKRWWERTYVPPARMLDSNLEFMLGSYKLHWTSKVVHAISDFWMKYWQWCMGFGLALVGLILKH